MHKSDIERNVRSVWQFVRWFKADLAAAVCVRISFFHRHLRRLGGNMFLTSRLGFLNMPLEISLDSSPQMRYQTSLTIRYKSTNAKVKKCQNMNIWVNIYDFKLLYDWKLVVNVKHWPLLKGEIIIKHNFSTCKKCIRTTGVSDTGTCCHASWDRSACISDKTLMHSSVLPS